MCEDYVDKLVAQTNSHTAAIAEDPSGTAVSEEVMPLDVIYGIFGNIREIFKIHARFFDRIKVSTWTLMLDLWKPLVFNFVGF